MSHSTRPKYKKSAATTFVTASTQLHSIIIKKSSFSFHYIYIYIYSHDSAEMLFHLVALAAVSSATALPPHYTSDSSAVAPNTTTLDKRDCVPYKNTCAGPSFLRIDDRHAHLTISRCRESHEHSPLISSSVDLNDCLAAASGHLVPGRGYCSSFQGS